MPHIDPEFIQTLHDAINCKGLEDLNIVKALTAYIEWKTAKTAQYPDVPEFYHIQRFDGSWTSPSELKWKGRIIENQLYPLCEIGLICPDCGSANTCYSGVIQEQVCFNCDRIFSQEVGRQLLADRISKGEVLCDAIDEDDCNVASVSVPHETKITIAKLRKSIEEDSDEGFVTYGK